MHLAKATYVFSPEEGINGSGTNMAASLYCKKLVLLYIQNFLLVNGVKEL